MDSTELIQEISVKEVNIDKFVQMALGESHIRDEIINQLTTHPHIMVYYTTVTTLSQKPAKKDPIYFTPIRLRLFPS